MPLASKAKIARTQGADNETDIAQGNRRQDIDRDDVGWGSERGWLRIGQRGPQRRYSRLLPEQAGLLPVAGMLQGRQPWGTVPDASARVIGVRRAKIRLLYHRRIDPVDNSVDGLWIHTSCNAASLRLTPSSNFCLIGCPYA